MERLSAARPFTIAVILAGGSGCRASQPNISGRPPKLPKQFWLLGGRPIWQHSWLQYAQHPLIDRVCVVWPAAFLEEGKQQLLKYCTGNLAPTISLAGGENRSDSSFMALKLCRQWQQERPEPRVQVLFHDAARPLVSERIIDETLAGLNVTDAVVCALPAKDSIFMAKDQKVCQILKRDFLMQSQTPQGFALETIYRAFCLYQNDPDRENLLATDDIAVVKQYLPSTDIHIIRGEASNMKLTEAADLDLLGCYYRAIQAKVRQSDE